MNMLLADTDPTCTLLANVKCGNDPLKWPFLFLVQVHEVWVWKEFLIPTRFLYSFSGSGPLRVW